MRLFTVDERKKNGIRLVQMEGDYFISTGHTVGQAIPLGKTMRDLVDGLMSKLRTSTKDEFIEDGGERKPNPLYGVNPDSIPPPRITQASFSDDGLRLVREKKRDRLAMVNVCTMAGVGGRLFWTARSYEQHLAYGRVRQRHNGFVRHEEGDGGWVGTTTAGVEILAIGHGQQSEPHALIVMHPGAGFRLRRNGELYDASPELHVLWTGDELKCFTPKHLMKKAQAA